MIKYSLFLVHSCLFTRMVKHNRGGGGGGKALTMTTDILESASWSMVKMVISWSNLHVHSKEIGISVMVMIKMGIFVVKFRG